MEPTKASKKLFQVVVVVGASLATTSCSSSSAPTTPNVTGDAASNDDTGNSDDAAMQGNDTGTMTEAGADAPAMETGMPSSGSADSCAGWAPCC